MNQTDREKEQLKAMIDAGRPLPPPYKADLFDQRREAELIWTAKSGEVANVVLPVHPHNRVTQITNGHHGVTGVTALRLEKAGSFRPGRSHLELAEAANLNLGESTQQCSPVKFAIRSIKSGTPSGPVAYRILSR